MKKLILFLVFLIFSNNALYAENYVVSADGSGDYPTIQAAINASSDGDTIFLEDGIFSGTGNYNISYQGKAITVCSQSGNAQNCIIDIQGEYNSVSQRAFSFTNGETATSVLKDITIQNGVADGP